jgi:hypothetical protein
MYPHPVISYELSRARTADQRRQAQREGLARAAAHREPPAPRPSRKSRPAGRYLWAVNRRRARQVPAT